MYIGIDIGGTNIKSGVIDASGKIIFSSSFKTDTTKSANKILIQIKNSIYELLKQFPGIKSIGVGCPGIIDNNGILHISPNLPKWEGINLHYELNKDFKFTIAVDNDANAAAIAELEIGGGKDLEDFIYITLGTGIGGAIIINKKIYKGSTGGAGEIGHTIINYDFMKKDIPLFRQGTLEEFAGRNQIITNYQLLITNEEFKKCNDIKSNETFDVEDIVKEANSGFKTAIDCLKETGEIIGIGLASAMNLLDIPFAIIGGGISQAGEILFDSVRQTIKERSLPTISERFEVREAYFKHNTGIIGAAMLGANKLKEMQF